MPGYTPSKEPIKVIEQNPIGQQYISDKVSESNLAASTYYYYFDMAGYNHCSFQFVLTGTLVLTIEGTMQDDGTAQAACSYDDISSMYGAANWTADASLVDSAGVARGYKYLRVKVDATGGGGTADWDINTTRSV